MLPFLKRNEKSVAGLIVKQRAPDEKPESEKDQENQEHNAAIEACAQDLIEAIHSKDIRSVADALRSAFEILETLPHDEVEHDNSYEGRNQAAAEED